MLLKIFLLVSVFFSLSRGVFAFSPAWLRSFVEDRVILETLNILDVYADLATRKLNTLWALI
jgi:hypothetical protein